MSNVSNVDLSNELTNQSNRLSSAIPLTNNLSYSLAPLGPINQESNTLTSIRPLNSLPPININTNGSINSNLPIIPLQNITSSIRSPGNRSPGNRSPGNRSPGNRRYLGNRSPNNRRSHGNRSPGNRRNRSSWNRSPRNRSPANNRSPRNIPPENNQDDNYINENISQENIPPEDISQENIPPEDISQENIPPENNQDDNYINENIEDYINSEINNEINIENNIPQINIPELPDINSHVNSGLEQLNEISNNSRVTNNRRNERRNILNNPPSKPLPSTPIQSPRDNTPITIEGIIIDRDSIPSLSNTDINDTVIEIPDIQESEEMMPSLPIISEEKLIPDLDETIPSPLISAASPTFNNENTAPPVIQDFQRELTNSSSETTDENTPLIENNRISRIVSSPQYSRLSSEGSSSPESSEEPDVISMEDTSNRNEEENVTDVPNIIINEDIDNENDNNVEEDNNTENNVEEDINTENNVEEDINGSSVSPEFVNIPINVIPNTNNNRSESQFERPIYGTRTTRPQQPRTPRTRRKTNPKKRRRVRRRVKIPKPVQPAQSTIPDYESMSQAEQASRHADFNVKFGILRKAYPQFNIPYFDDSVSLEIKHRHYERYVRQIHIDNSVGNYKVYLIILFACIELFCVKILGLNLGGYTFNQMALLNKYERLLIELGEKSYGSIGSSWPVETRIVFMALFNAIIFLIIRLFSAYLGPGLGNIIHQIVNSFMNKEDPSDQIKKAQNMSLGEPGESDSVPDIPPKNNGFDFGSLMNGLSGMFGGSNNSRPRANRRPTYTE
uniref:Uncharacterized protein n=1 Tax=Pithovirus LCPAC302 TaxID=2506593 RepID=A0A481Z6T6_9VIRU|nr:MAG: uncharacterized protein LCPAC302_02130 [Pithovirus LCPAC302]